ncbi:ImmA/IrrE family metallo-endopeptidase [Arthrobacter sp. VKM Ac-2550]|uniref:ImmA/IrrE family metallo-endopeptidase n=1 Tax=Crystallibacter permensis TaxID=1938888 RepID=UPI002225EFD5|nr:ImmA/IrrE family metallo-endopeptidase [Arthrobacter sp. VKM Ac-2550]MCW2135019.1 Zn-dependent peptidase ImmA, M78 family [Arthrobacter sp. VKM Ac-2550]
MSMTNDARAAAAAAALRRKYDLGHAPINDLTDLVEGRMGIDVAVLEMDQGLDGMVIQDPETGQRIISVACTTSMERQRSTLAHELGHLELGDFAQDGVIRCGVRDDEEIRADAFARHLLAPREGLLDFLRGLGRAPGSVTEADLSHAVRYFGVSPMIILIQLDRSNWLAPGQMDGLSTLSVGRLAARHGWGDEHRASQRKAQMPQPPMRIVAEAMEAYENNLIGLEAVAGIRGMSAAELQAELDEYGIHPKPVAAPLKRFGRRP